MARAPLRDTDPARVGSYRLTARLGTAGASAITALVESGSAVTGIGSIATQQAQQPVTVALPAG